MEDHTLIRFALLALFVVGLDDADWIVRGFGAGLVSTPLMLGLERLGWEMWAVESTAVVTAYLVTGILLLLGHESFRKRARGTWWRWPVWIKRGTAVSLGGYFALTMVVMSQVLFYVAVRSADLIGVFC